MLLREPNQHLREVFMGRQEDSEPVRRKPTWLLVFERPPLKGQSSPIAEMRIIWFEVNLSGCD